MRLLGKWLGCRAGARWLRLPLAPTPWLGFGLIAQGGQALALLIDLSLAETARTKPLVSVEVIMLLQTVVILSIIANEFAAPACVRRVLAQAGEWRSKS
jgi:hypothetical protein